MCISTEILDDLRGYLGYLFINAEDGQVLWNKRLTGTHSASPVYADGRIYILSETGTTLVLEPGVEYKELASNPLNEKCLASMAVSNGKFYIRGINHLFCIITKIFVFNVSHYATPFCLSFCLRVTLRSMRTRLFLRLSFFPTSGVFLNFSKFLLLCIFFHSCSVNA